MTPYIYIHIYIYIYIHIYIHTRQGKGIQGKAPPYIVKLCKYVNTIESCRRLHSAAGGQLIVSRTFTDIERRAFAYASPSAWNNLPTELRLSSTNSSFCTGLKTFLFVLPMALTFKELFRHPMLTLF